MDLMAAPGILRLLVHQCLLPRLCAECALPLSALQQFPALALSVTQGDFQRWKDQLGALVGEAGLQQMRVRQPEGCAHCINPELPDLNGWQGRIVSAEILDPILYPDYLSALHHKQPVLPDLLQQGWRPLRYNALQQALLGLIDPFDLERYFSVFNSAAWQGYKGG